MATKKAPARKTAAKKTAPKTTGKRAAPAAKKAAVSSKTSAPAKKPAAKKAAPRRPVAAQPGTAKSASVAPPPLSQAEKTAAAKPKSSGGYTDMKALADTVAEVNERTRSVFGEVAEKAAKAATTRPDASDADPFHVREAATEVAQAIVSDPVGLAEMQMGLWGDYARLFAQTTERMMGMGAEEDAAPIAPPAPGDRRFGHAAWTENPMLDFIKQSYLLTSRWIDRAIDEAPDVDDATRRRARFHTDQFISAMSPSNVPGLNPDVLDETLASKGQNWTRGLKNFLEDMEKGHGELAITQADMDAFEVGENVATTPGSVVYQNRLMQLIQYAPITEKVAKRPLVIFPPWINKFYILDLQPQNSFIKWAVDQGRTVFVVSWVNPGPELRGVGFEDYMHEGVFAALSAIEQATGETDVDAIGYCIGGTLLACTLAYMARKKDERIKTATFFTAQTDFSEAGDLKVFVDEEQLASMAKRIDAAGGVLEGSDMARTFNMLRPNDLIWAAFVDNYYLGREAKKFDLLFWNADATRMTEACHNYYLRTFYQQNALAEGTLEMAGEPIRLENIKIPAYFQAGEKDHIAPPGSVYKSARLLGGDARFMLAGSGHIAGVVNPPARKKYHYRTNKDLPPTMEEWVETAELHEHSWWPNWNNWLTNRSPGTVKARVPGDGKLDVIEAAPGSYVKVRCD